MSNLRDLIDEINQLKGQIKKLKHALKECNKELSSLQTIDITFENANKLRLCLEKIGISDEKINTYFVILQKLNDDGKLKESSKLKFTDDYSVTTDTYIVDELIKALKNLMKNYYYINNKDGFKKYAKNGTEKYIDDTIKNKGLPKESVLRYIINPYVVDYEKNTNKLKKLNELISNMDSNINPLKHPQINSLNHFKRYNKDISQLTDSVNTYHALIEEAKTNKYIKDESKILIKQHIEIIRESLREELSEENLKKNKTILENIVALVEMYKNYGSHHKSKSIIKNNFNKCDIEKLIINIGIISYRYELNMIKVYKLLDLVQTHSYNNSKRPFIKKELVKLNRELVKYIDIGSKSTYKHEINNKINKTYRQLLNKFEPVP